MRDFRIADRPLAPFISPAPATSTPESRRRLHDECRRCSILIGQFQKSARSRDCLQSQEPALLQLPNCLSCNAGSAFRIGQAFPDPLFRRGDLAKPRLRVFRTWRRPQKRPPIFLCAFASQKVVPTPREKVVDDVSAPANSSLDPFASCRPPSTKNMSANR